MQEKDTQMYCNDVQTNQRNVWYVVFTFENTLYIPR